MSFFHETGYFADKNRAFRNLSAHITSSLDPHADIFAALVSDGTLARHRALDPPALRSQEAEYSSLRRSIDLPNSAPPCDPPSHHLPPLNTFYTNKASTAPVREAREAARELLKHSTAATKTQRPAGEDGRVSVRLEDYEALCRTKGASASSHARAHVSDPHSVARQLISRLELRIASDLEAHGGVEDSDPSPFMTRLRRNEEVSQNSPGSRGRSRTPPFPVGRASILPPGKSERACRQSTAGNPLSLSPFPGDSSACGPEGDGAWMLSSIPFQSAQRHRLASPSGAPAVLQAEPLWGPWHGRFDELTNFGEICDGTAGRQSTEAPRACAFPVYDEGMSLKGVMRHGTNVEKRETAKLVEKDKRPEAVMAEEFERRKRQREEMKEREGGGAGGEEKEKREGEPWLPIDYNVHSCLQSADVRRVCAAGVPQHLRREIPGRWNSILSWMDRRRQAAHDENLAFLQRQGSSAPCSPSGRNRRGRRGKKEADFPALVALLRAMGGSGEAVVDSDEISWDPSGPVLWRLRQKRLRDEQPLFGALRPVSAPPLLEAPRGIGLQHLHRDAATGRLMVSPLTARAVDDAVSLFASAHEGVEGAAHRRKERDAGREAVIAPPLCVTLDHTGEAFELAPALNKIPPDPLDPVAKRALRASSHSPPKVSGGLGDLAAALSPGAVGKPLGTSQSHAKKKDSITAPNRASAIEEFRKRQKERREPGEEWEKPALPASEAHMEAADAHLVLSVVARVHSRMGRGRSREAEALLSRLYRSIQESKCERLKDPPNAEENLLQPLGALRLARAEQTKLQMQRSAFQQKQFLGDRAARPPPSQVEMQHAAGGAMEKRRRLRLGEKTGRVAAVPPLIREAGESNYKELVEQIRHLEEQAFLTSHGRVRTQSGVFLGAGEGMAEEVMEDFTEAERPERVRKFVDDEWDLQSDVWTDTGEQTKDRYLEEEEGGEMDMWHVRTAARDLCRQDIESLANYAPLLEACERALMSREDHLGSLLRLLFRERDVKLERPKVLAAVRAAENEAFEDQEVLVAVALGHVELPINLSSSEAATRVREIKMMYEEDELSRGLSVNDRARETSSMAQEDVDVGVIDDFQEFRLTLQHIAKKATDGTELSCKTHPKFLWTSPGDPQFLKELWRSPLGTLRPRLYAAAGAPSPMLAPAPKEPLRPQRPSRVSFSACLSQWPPKEADRVAEGPPQLGFLVLRGLYLALYSKDPGPQASPGWKEPVIAMTLDSPVKLTGEPEDPFKRIPKKHKKKEGWLRAEGWETNVPPATTDDVEHFKPQPLLRVTPKGDVVFPRPQGRKDNRVSVVFYVSDGSVANAKPWIIGTNEGLMYRSYLIRAYILEAKGSIGVTELCCDKQESLQRKRLRMSGERWSVRLMQSFVDFQLLNKNSEVASARFSGIISMGDRGLVTLYRSIDSSVPLSPRIESGEVRTDQRVWGETEGGAPLLQRACNPLGDAGVEVLADALIQLADARRGRRGGQEQEEFKKQAAEVDAREEAVRNEDRQRQKDREKEAQEQEETAEGKKEEEGDGQNEKEKEKETSSLIAEELPPQAPPPPMSSVPLSLKALSLREVGATPHGAIKLMDAVEQSETAGDKLLLDRNKITDGKAIGDAARSLISKVSVSTLSLSENKLGKQFVKEMEGLTEMIEKGTATKFATKAINLAGNDLSAKDTCKLASILFYCHSAIHRSTKKQDIPPLILKAGGGSLLLRELAANAMNAPDAGGSASDGKDKDKKGGNSNVQGGKEEDIEAAAIAAAAVAEDGRGSTLMIRPQSPLRRMFDALLGFDSAEPVPPLLDVFEITQMGLSQAPTSDYLAVSEGDPLRRARAAAAWKKVARYMRMGFFRLSHGDGKGGPARQIAASSRPLAPSWPKLLTSVDEIGPGPQPYAAPLPSYGRSPKRSAALLNREKSAKRDLALYSMTFFPPLYSDPKSAPGGEKTVETHRQEENQ
uniref:Uncharacterized protein n=1 Tax=Chromera velia CCMP2878 TaxID=1169474 RepID=A0A0G4FTJ0_9ALVE|eukprot:Cvel_18552.t1-p1 / transcript=Cvel_18552.t1 / gene=Cvel_18552 / organism=Chromera_velia_CCMP2878 / gene_product=hypothetical protein / transcript_product=hypothetical protein / location=Cvel_scaffold1545:1755-16134(+) / protein_length=1956 / sequence_SO=supercontig / SO=protein_coding / is_pseudo=false